MKALKTKPMKVKPTSVGKYLALLFLFALFSLNAQQLAFPAAKGAGAYASGGRGGQVIHVTTLDWAAPGGLREAITTQGSRTIIFDVSGEIDATQEGDFSKLIDGPNYDNITIAGQTAPAGGITILTNEFMFWDVSNIIIRYVRFRGAGITQDAINIQGGANIILDHSTFSHGGDESMDVGSGYGRAVDPNIIMDNVTIQNCFIQDSKTGGIIGTEGGAASFETEFTFINNVFSNISHRFPNTKGNGRYDIINNIVYNWKARLTRLSNAERVNLINNYYKPSINGLRQSGWFGNGSTTINQHKIRVDNNATEIPLVHASGSIVTTEREVPQNDDSDMFTAFYGSPSLPEYSPVPSSYFTNTPFPLVGQSYNIKTAIETYIELLMDVGADKTLNADGGINYYRDNKDAADINMIQNDSYSGSFYDARTSIPYPSIPQNTRPENFYNPAKSEHIPEVFYDLYMASSGATHNDIDPDSGYTWLEVYLNGVDRTIPENHDIETLVLSPDNDDLRVGETIELDAIVNGEPELIQNGNWSSSDPTFATVDENGLVTAISTIDVPPYQTTITITFTTIDINDEEFSATSEITVFPEALIVSAGTDQQICQGESTTLEASGGTSYLWNIGETTAVIEVAPTETTTYSVIITDDYEQSEEVNVTINVIESPAANAGEDQTICQGEFIVLTATGGTTYLWSTGETTESIEVNPELETTYEVEVISNDCSSTDSVTVFVNNAPDITISEDVVIVEGESTMLIASGSDDYEWSTGETTESITVNPMVTTTYSVSSIGVNGCSSSLDVIVTVIPEVIADAGDDVTICNGDSVTLNASGGGTYIWDTGDSSSSVIVNPETTTTYTVTVEDDYGYTDTDSVTIIVNELPDIVADDDVFVMIGNAVTISAAGGDTYSWNTGETTASITVTPDVSTTYSVTGFSSNGCQSTVDVLVTVVEELNANAGEDVSICIGSSVTLGASGGVTYTWNTGDTGSSPTFTPDVTTTYSVTVTDGFGNSDTDDVTITVDSMPTAYAGEDQTVCEGDSVILTAGGGTSYLWSTGDTTASINVNPISNTTYTVEVFNNTCSDSDDVTINVMSTPDLIISDDAVVMIGNSTTIDVSGADSYLWNTGETSNSLIVTPEETITYTVTGFGVNGCQNTAQVTVTVVPQVVANAGNDITICEGDSVVLNATGGVTYSWNNGIAGASLVASPNITTTYTVTVTDAYGNSDSDSIVVTVNETPNVTVSESITIIEGESTVLNAYGAEAYIWSTGDTSNSIIINPVQTTTYSVVGTTNSCSAEVFVTVYVEELFVASAGVDIQVCDNQSYQIVLTANQGDSYLWNTGETTQSIVVSPLSTTEYVVTITNGVQEDTDEVIVFVNPSPTVEIANGESVEILNGDFITLSASGANTYEWNNGATQPNIAVSPSATTIYEVRGFVGDCYDEKQVTVNVLQPVEADAGEDVIICLDEIATLTATGGDDYVWSTGETTQTIQVSPTETTDYTVTVFNALDFDEASVRVEVDLNCQIETVVPPIDEILDFSFDIFPNPAVNSVNVKLSGTTIGSDVFIFDLTGKIVKHTEIYNEELSPVTTAQIDISALQSGVYFVKLIDEDRDITKKLIVR